MQEIKIADLGFSEKARVTWAFFWRALVITIGSTLSGTLLGGVFGFVVGIIVSANGGTKESIVTISKIGGGTLGLFAGLFFFYLYIRWLLASKLGNYKLVLTQHEFGT